MDDASFIKTVEGLLKSCKLGVRPNEQEVLPDKNEYKFDGEQSDLYRLQEKLLGYAETKAKGLSTDAPADAVNKVFDKAVGGRKIDSWGFAKTIIDNHLNDLRRKQSRGKELVSFEVEPWDIKHFIDVYSGDFDEDTRGYGETEKGKPTLDYLGFLIPDKHGYPNTNPYRLSNNREREICIMYWIEYKEQHEIVKELGIDKRRVSEVIGKYRADPKLDTRDMLSGGIIPKETPASPVVYKHLPLNKKQKSSDAQS